MFPRIRKDFSPSFGFPPGPCPLWFQALALSAACAAPAPPRRGGATAAAAAGGPDGHRTTEAEPLRQAPGPSSAELDTGHVLGDVAGEKIQGFHGHGKVPQYMIGWFL